ncbi:MAG: hypothetical protein J5598_04045 [Clostridia bacterium]|nr:hypothetical protein [Clostridia bacterium]
MKLEKGEILAIIETLCFIAGAVFFILVITIPSNPIWALIVGISCGLTGAIIWLCSLIIRTAGKVGHKIHNQIERTVVDKVDAEKIAKSIFKDEDDTYELHRVDTYPEEIKSEPASATEPSDANQ